MVNGSWLLAHGSRELGQGPGAAAPLPPTDTPAAARGVWPKPSGRRRPGQKRPWPKLSLAEAARGRSRLAEAVWPMPALAEGVFLPGWLAVVVALRSSRVGVTVTVKVEKKPTR